MLRHTRHFLKTHFNGLITPGWKPDLIGHWQFSTYTVLVKNFYSTKLPPIGQLSGNGTNFDGPWTLDLITGQADNYIKLAYLVGGWTTREKICSFQIENHLGLNFWGTNIQKKHLSEPIFDSSSSNSGYFMRKNTFPNLQQLGNNENISFKCPFFVPAKLGKNSLHLDAKNKNNSCDVTNHSLHFCSCLLLEFVNEFWVVQAMVPMFNH